MGSRSDEVPSLKITVKDDKTSAPKEASVDEPKASTSGEGTNKTTGKIVSH